MKPFLRWTGSKFKCKDEIINSFPIKFNNYYEPFFGSGSIFFNLVCNKRIFNKAYLSDINPHLINCYLAVRDEPERVKKVLVNMLEKNSEEFYYSMRPLVSRPSVFLYLNRAGFSSMYRVNSKGEFNVPYRVDDFVVRRKKISMDTSAIDQCSEYLKKYAPAGEDGWLTHSIARMKWENALTGVNSGDLVYLDPPYVPYKENGFVHYSEGGFNENDHVYMNNICKVLKSKGAYVYMSNSYTKKSVEIFGEPKKIIGVSDNINAYAVEKGKRLEGLWIW
jgi:DNA adenine methylase